MRWPSSESPQPVQNPGSTRSHHASTKHSGGTRTLENFSIDGGDTIAWGPGGHHVYSYTSELCPCECSYKGEFEFRVQSYGRGDAMGVIEKRFKDATVHE